MSKDRKPCNIVVHRINLDDTFVRCLEYAKKNCRDSEKIIEVGIHGSLGYIDTPNGLYVLDTDGVGMTDPLTDSNRLEIGVMVTRSAENGGKTITIVPEFNLTYNDPEDIRKLGGEVVPLHEFIRSFGSRLEENYRDWVRDFDKHFETTAVP